MENLLSLKSQQIQSFNCSTNTELGSNSNSKWLFKMAKTREQYLKREKSVDNTWGPLRSTAGLKRCFFLPIGTNPKNKNLLTSFGPFSVWYIHMYIMWGAVQSWNLSPCRDQWSCKIFVSCVNFPRKQRSFLHILQVQAHRNVKFLCNC